MIPVLKPITVEPRPLNARLWELVAKELDGSISLEEREELEGVCAELEGGAMPSARAASLRPQPASRFSRSGIAIADNDQ